MNSLSNKKISFIGGGNMAQAMISGLLAEGMTPDMITVVDPNLEKREMLANKGLMTVDSLDNPKQAIESADIIILAVKPQAMRKVVAEFPDVLDNQLIISVAAGLSIDTLSDMLGGYSTIVRAMPNTPAMIQLGASGMYAPLEVSDEHKEQAYSILAASGLAIWVEEESKLHAVTAVSGSAPAYFFLFLEAMIDGAIEQGLTKEQASALAMQTALGAAQMAISSDLEPSQLRGNVTSPNGTTHEAIESMKSSKVDEAIKLAMQACSERSQEISIELS